MSSYAVWCEDAAEWCYGMALLLERQKLMLVFSDATARASRARWRVAGVAEWDVVPEGVLWHHEIRRDGKSGVDRDLCRGAWMVQMEDEG